MEFFEIRQTSISHELKKKINISQKINGKGIENRSIDTSQILTLYSIDIHEIKKERKRKIPWKWFRIGNRVVEKVDQNVISGEFDRPPISAYFSKANGTRKG